MVSAHTQVSLLRQHVGHSFGLLFSLSLVEAEDGWSIFPLSKAGQLIQQWWLPYNLYMAQFYAACSMGIISSLDAHCNISTVLLEHITTEQTNESNTKD